MHLVFLHLLPVFFLNHTLWHYGGVGSRWKHQQGLQQAREKQAIHGVCPGPVTKEEQITI